jgi:hypothetical protein
MGTADMMGLTGETNGIQSVVLLRDETIVRIKCQEYIKEGKSVQLNFWVPSKTIFFFMTPLNLLIKAA